MKTTQQVAAEWISEHVVLSEHCDTEYSDLTDKLAQLLTEQKAQGSHPVDAHGPLGVRVLSAPNDGKRVESGAIQFGDDWAGAFVRGDHAAYYSSALDSLLNGSVDPITIGILSGLNEILKSSRQF